MSEFYTPKGYRKNIDSKGLTESMEDYLEMLYREKITRIKDLAANLNVKPSSASKMVNVLKNKGYVDYQKYGMIRLTEKGIQTGEYLLKRHQVLNQLFCYLNHTSSETKQVEQIEHYVTPETILNIEKFLEKILPF